MIKKVFTNIAKSVTLKKFTVIMLRQGVEVRLSGGRARAAGPVELRLGGKWGSVCDSRFDDFDAQVRPVSVNS